MDFQQYPEDGTDWPVRGLVLKNFRRFDDYSLPNLSRVTLLVGGNNCGKTSVLEAVEFAVMRGTPGALIRAAKRRSQGSGAPVLIDGSDPNTRARGFNVSQWFHGHEMAEGSEFSVEVKGRAPSLRVTVKLPRNAPGPRAIIGATGPTGGFGWPPGPPFSEDDENLLALCVASGDEAGEHVGGAVTTTGYLLQHNYRTLGVGESQEYRARPFASVVHVGTLGISAGTRREIWSSVVRQGGEEDIVDVLRFVEPTLSSVHFLPDGPLRSSSSLDDILIGFSGTPYRTPLGNHGEGLRRLLDLALALFAARGGFLLLDEVDTGLHWQVMAKTWKLIISGARKFGTQVVATSHSLDAIRGLSRAMRGDSELRDVSIQRIDLRHNKAVELPGELFESILRQGVEVR